MKTNTMLRYISLPLGLIVTICLSQEVRADPVTFAAAAPFTLTSAVLSPFAVRMDCGMSAMFTLTLKGKGASDTAGESLRWSVYQDEALDDRLIRETSFTVFGDGTGTGNWVEVIEFTLECTDNCILRGADGSSGDRENLVFALIEFPFGTDLGESNNINVDCVSVPEPATMLLLSTGLAGVAIKTRKRLKRRKSGQEQ